MKLAATQLQDKKTLLLGYVVVAALAAEGYKMEPKQFDALRYALKMDARALSSHARCAWNAYDLRLSHLSIPKVRQLWRGALLGDRAPLAACNGARMRLCCIAGSSGAK